MSYFGYALAAKVCTRVIGPFALAMFAVLPACSSSSSGVATVASLPAIEMSFSDYYASYQWAWEHNQAQMEASLAAIRRLDFASYAQVMKSQQQFASLRIGSLTIAPKATDRAAADQVLQQLGKKYATVGAFFDAFDLKPVKQSESDLMASLAQFSDASAKSSPTAGLSLGDCKDWWESISDVARKDPEMLNVVGGLQKQMLDVATGDQTGGGSDNPHLKLYTEAQAVLKSSPTAWINFHNFMGNRCASPVKESEPATRAFAPRSPIQDSVQ